METRGKGTNRRRRRKSVEETEALVDPIGEESGNKGEANRVLLDVIRDADDPNVGAYKSLINHDKHKKSWKAFKDSLRLKRASQAWISAMPDEGERHRLLELFPPDEEESTEAGEELKRVLRPMLSRMTSFQPPENIRDDVPISDPPMRRPQILRHNSLRLSSSSMNAKQGEDVGPRVRFADQLAAEKEQIQRVVSSTEAYRHQASDSVEDEGIMTGCGRGGGEPAAKMSLMDLLEETDDHIGWASYMAELEDDDDDEEEDDDSAEEQSCCICMVRHKGRASGLCGHTFCRLCSKELSVGRGNCPRCNGFVLEILEIF